MSILDITAALFRERRRVVIALGFAGAIAIIPMAATLSSEHTPSGSERSVAGCIPFTEICFPDPAPPSPVETPAPVATPPLVNDDPIPPEDPPVNMGGVARVVY
jgi:hypothetical protein